MPTHDRNAGRQPRAPAQFDIVGVEIDGIFQ
jgi:hypothetical protein